MSAEGAGPCPCKATLNYPWKVMVMGGCLEERKCRSYLQEGQEEGSRELQASLPHLHPWGSEGTNTLENSSRLAKDKVTRSSWRGFMKKSCLTNLITACDEMPGLVDEMRAVDISCLGFNKAFHAVSHNIFIDKLMKYGLDKWSVW